MASSKILALYDDLTKQHASPESLWPQWTAKVKDQSLRELIAIGAILTQRTSWRNAHQALLNLKSANLLSLVKLAEVSDLKNLELLIKPAGFYTTKPKRLISFAKYVVDNYSSLDNLLKVDTANLREELLGVYGIGEETADTILLFVLDKPSFIADEYTRRFLLRENLIRDTKIGYSAVKQLFESSLPQDAKLFQRYHILIIRSQKGDTWSKMEIV